MTNDCTTRAMTRADLDDVRSILDRTELFPAAMLAPIAEPFLSGRAAHVWCVVALNDRTIGFAYCEPEHMTDGTFNLLAIAVDPDHQRGGAGTGLMRGVEAVLRRRAARLLLVETSSEPDQEGARSFYIKDGFTEEARIRDFYAPGQHKVVFWKQL